MPRELASPLPRSRYSYAAAALEVQRELAARPRGTQKELAAACSLTEQQFSHRLRGARAAFALEHWGAIADALDMPAGWPFIPAQAAPRRPRR